MLTKRIVVKKVEEFAGELITKGIHLKKVFLFGSYATNKQKRFSDIDVALVADEFCGVGYEDMKLFSEINNKKPYIYIETKTYPTKYFIKGDPFIDEIKKTGIEIKID